MSDASEAIRSRLQQALVATLSSQESFDHAKELKTAFEWAIKYNKARKEPDGVRLMLINMLVEKLLESLNLKFVSVTFNETVQSKPRPDLELSLPTIESNLYLVIFVNGAPTPRSTLEIRFALDSEVSFKELQVVSDEKGKHLTAQSMDATVTLFVLAKMMFRKKKIRIDEAHFSTPVSNFSLSEGDIRKSSE